MDRIPKKQVTLKDVSAATGVSIMTVSNVINNRTKNVSLRTREKVQDAIKKLNYRPNQSGRTLRNAKNLSIALVVADQELSFLSDPFISALASGLCNVLGSRGYSLAIQGVRPKKFEQAGAFQNATTDAVCVILGGPKIERAANLEYLATIQQPVVVLQENQTSSHPDMCRIRQNDHEAGRLIAEHLLDRRQFKDVLFLKPAFAWPAIEERENGIRSEFANKGKQKNLHTATVKNEAFQDVCDLVRKLLEDQEFDCIIAATDAIGMAVLATARELGISVPRDLSVAGFNGFEFWQYSEPRLTTVVSPAYAMGCKAAECVLERLQNGEFTKKEIVFPVHLQIGGST